MSFSILSSFDGISFYIRSITDSGFNNRPVLHEIVNGKYGPYVEVMGRGAEIFSVDGFVSTNTGTYLDKNLLREVFKTTKTGYFLHPDLGLKQCACLSVAMSEDAARIGVINLRIEFVVINNSHYSISTASSGSLSSVVSRATNYLSSVSLDGVGTSALSVIGTGESIMKGISGFDPVLNTIGQTMGRFYQAGEIGASVLNQASTLSEAIPLVEQKMSNVTKSLTS